MPRLTVYCFAAAFLLSLAQPSAANDWLHTFYEQVQKDMDPRSVPKGYTVDLIEATARSNEDRHQKVDGRIWVRFKRDGLIVKQSEFGAQGWEGFTYFVFATPEAAAKFHLFEPEAVSNLNVWAGGDWDNGPLSADAWRGSTTVSIKSAAGNGDLKLSCMAVDYYIGCLSVAPKSYVAIYLVLQEPRLRTATSDAERLRLLAARVEKETHGLMKAAEQHLAASMKAAGPKLPSVAK